VSRPFVCLIKDTRDKAGRAWFVWWGADGRQLREQSLENALRKASELVEPSSTAPIATPYGVWLGSINDSPQLTLGKRKPEPVDEKDVIGKRIFTGMWTAAWDTFATHARML
jgi:hypothetical protein